jgi:hypothetical protein
LTAIPVVAGRVVRWRYVVAQTDSIASIHFADWRYANMETKPGLESIALPCDRAHAHGLIVVTGASPDQELASDAGELGKIEDRRKRNSYSDDESKPWRTALEARFAQPSRISVLVVKN